MNSIENIQHEVLTRVRNEDILDLFLKNLFKNKSKNCRKHSEYLLKYIQAGIYRTRTRRLDNDISYGEIHRNDYAIRFNSFKRLLQQDCNNLMGELDKAIKEAEDDYRVKRQLFRSEPCYCE